MRKSMCLSARPLALLLAGAWIASACGGQTAANNPWESLPEAAVPGSFLADLDGDTLVAPNQPALEIRAFTDTLLFEWAPIADQRVARLYHHDTLLGGETLVHESDDTLAGSFELPSNTPRTAWHREQYRLELCTADNCVSSPRTALTGLAAATSQQLSPAVFLRGERYAEHLSLNHDASLAVLSMPVEGALEFQIRTGSRWSMTQHLRLEGLKTSTTRTILPSVSSSGDTVALYLRDEPNKQLPQIRILERLGETWVQSDAWTMKAGDTRDSSDEQVLPNDEVVVNVPHTLQLSADGDHLLMQNSTSVSVWSRGDIGWTGTTKLLRLDEQDIAPNNATPDRILSSSASRHFERIATLYEIDGDPVLQIWSDTNHSGDWQSEARLPVLDFDARHELDIELDAQGNRLMIAGWEVNGSLERVPIMWRYQLDTLPDAQDSSNSLVLRHRDSLRAGPATQPQATLLFSTDQSLTLAALGWQVAENPAAETVADTAIDTWQYHSTANQWLSALELNDKLPTRAKQSLIRGLVLSGDGSTLMMSILQYPASPDSGGTVMVLR